MALSDELRDPWGLVVAGVAGGLAWALSGVVVAGAAVGAGVYGAKVLTGLVTRRGEDEPAVPQLPRPPKGTAAGWWFDRALAAVGSLRSLAASAPPGPLAESVRGAAATAESTLHDLARVGAQVGAVEAAERRVDVAGLDEEAGRLEHRARSAPTPELADELRRAAAAVRDRAAVAARLDQARETLLARMEATALGLEGLVARLAEVLALTSTTGTASTAAVELDGLATELDGLRAGLAETEALSRRALAGLQEGPAGPSAG
jgi:hypothetical protein